MAKAKTKAKKSAEAAEPKATVKGVGKTYPIGGARKFEFTEQPSEFSFDYTSPGPHCEVDRLKQGRCAVQLNYLNGKPVLRLCGEYGKPGRVIQVNGPADAQLKAQKFCTVRKGGRQAVEEEEEQLEGWRKQTDFEEPIGLGETAEDAAVGTVYALAAAARGSSRSNARQARPAFNFGEASPQPARRAPERRGPGSVNPSTWWLVGGTIAGVAVATMLKKSAAAPKA